jgi:hypothetical protein
VVSDDLAKVSYKWTLTVVNVNRPPVIDAYTPVDLEPQVDEGDSLNFTHTSSDPDNETLTYSWLLDDVEHATNQNWTYSPGYDAAGMHNVTLVVSDGELFDSQEWNVTVLNVNQPPEASNLTISPSSPHTTDNLTANYTYTDSDGDPESGTEIRWYADGFLQPEFNDELNIPSSATDIGEEWYFTVRPKDGTDFGDLQESPPVTITA